MSITTDGTAPPHTSADANLFDLVDHAYVINLPNRPDRREAIVDELTGLVGATSVATRVTVVDGRRPTVATPFASVGVQGCFLSHLAVLEMARAAGHEAIAVFEDDAHISDDVRDLLAELVADLINRPWDLVHLGYLPREFSVGPTAFQRSVLEQVGLAPRPPVEPADSRLVRMRGSAQGAHFYVVHRRCLDALIAHLHRCLGGAPGDDLFGPIPLDGAYNTFEWTHEIVRLVAVPPVAGQRSSRSDITPRPIDRLAPLRPLIAEVRRRRERQSPNRYSSPPDPTMTSP